jgi:O-methyltransferase
MKSLIQRMLAPFGYQIQSTRSERKLFLRDPPFLALYEQVRSNTVTQIDRCFMLYQAALATASLPESVAELGVYKGGTAKLWGEVLKNHGKRIYLFDNFSGMPWTEKDTESHDAMFEDVTLANVQEYLKDYPAMDFRPGFFPDTARGLENEKFSLVYLDADLYESTKNGLEFFYPRMVYGGIILFDDYGSHRWTGVREAVDAFAKSVGNYAISTVPYQAMLIKH